MDKQTIIKDNILESVELKQSLLSDPQMHELIANVTDLMITSLNDGGKILFCGNGGSAADAQHLAAEFSGRYYYDRPPLNAEALHVNTSYLTAVANDYSYEEVFSRLVKGIGQKGDVLVGMSTSGNSKNVIRAFIQAKELGMTTVGMTGNAGGKMKDHADFLIDIPSKNTPRIQECHMLLGHIMCQMVEASIFPK